MCEGIQAHLFSLRCSYCGWQTLLYSSTGKDEWNDGDKLSGAPARSRGVGGTKKASRAVARDGSLSKMVFDKRVDGKASAAATATLYSFCLNPAGSGRKKSCKETLFALGNGIVRRKNPPVPAVHAAGNGCCSNGHPVLSSSPGFFDSLASREGSRGGSDPV